MLSLHQKHLFYIRNCGSKQILLFLINLPLTWKKNSRSFIWKENCSSIRWGTTLNWNQNWQKSAKTRGWRCRGVVLPGLGAARDPIHSFIHSFILSNGRDLRSKHIHSRSVWNPPLFGGLLPKESGQLRSFLQYFSAELSSLKSLLTNLSEAPSNYALKSWRNDCQFAIPNISFTYCH